MTKRARWLPFAAIVTLALGAGTASGATIEVTKTGDGGSGSLRAAIDEANAGAGADTIVLGKEKTYELTKCGPAGSAETANADGDLNSTAPDVLTIHGHSSTIHNTCPGERILEILNGDIDHLTFTNGRPLSAGGAIRGGTVHLSYVRLSGNHSPGDGGAIGAASLTVDHSTIINNDGWRGGGIYADDVAVRNSRVSGNEAKGVFGGGLVGEYHTTVIGSVISGNKAQQDGGGILGSSITIDGSTISGNRAGTEGGGVAYSQNGYAPYEMSVTASTISGNLAKSGNGGGVVSGTYDPVSFADSTIAENRASIGTGGGVFTPDGPILLLRSTVADNRATTGETGGIESDSSSLDIYGSILAGNTGDECRANPSRSFGHNLAGDSSCNLLDATDFPSTDPKLLPLADNGGPTQTVALKSSSPALDQIATSEACSATEDQRGAPRVPPCDIGAYERDECHGVVVNRVGTSGRDVLRGTNRADGIFGLGGNDALFGVKGNDALCGGVGKDKLNGGPGKDRCDGGPGRDTIVNCER